MLRRASADAYAPYRNFIVRVSRLPNREDSILIFDKAVKVLCSMPVDSDIRQLIGSDQSAYLVAFFDEDRWLHFIERVPNQNWVC